MIFNFVFSISGDFKILRDILRNQAVSAGVYFKERGLPQESEYIFSIKATEEELKDFAQQISSTIPLSIKFSFKELKVSQEDKEDFQKISETLEDVLDAQKIGNIIQNQDILEMKKWLKNPKFYNLDVLNEFELSFEIIIKNLLKKEKVLICNHRGELVISLEKISNQVMFWDIDTLKTFLRVDNQQLHALASYEKPSMMLCPKDIFIKDFDSEIIQCMLPYDLFLGILGKKCLENNINYVFVALNQKRSDFQARVIYDQEVPKMEYIVVGRNGVVLFQDSKRSGNLHKLLDSYKELDSPNNQNLAVCISKNNPLFFWIKAKETYKNTLQIDFELNPKLLLMMIRGYENGDRLIENFKKAFPTLEKRLEKIDNKSRTTQNIFELFSTIGFILGYSDALDSQIILQNARKYLRDKGPRIDFKLLKSDDGIVRLDYPRILRSCMSFRLAGVDEATLSYGILDSMSEFFCSFIQDLCINFSLQKVLIFGNALEEKVILDKILYYIPRDIDLVLPKKDFLDY